MKSDTAERVLVWVAALGGRFFNAAWVAVLAVHVVTSFDFGVGSAMWIGWTASVTENIIWTDLIAPRLSGWLAEREQRRKLRSLLQL